MAFVIAERVRETTLTTGTGTIDLAGATLAMRTFVAGIGTGNTTRYLIVSGNGVDWEIGTGTVTDAAPDTLSRTPEISTNANAAISLSGESRVSCINPANLNVLPDWAGKPRGLHSQIRSATPTIASTGLSTWGQQNGATVNDGATGVSITGSVIATDISIRYTTAVPATPYTITALIATDTVDVVNAFGAVFGWYDGTNKIEIIAFYNQAGGLNNQIDVLDYATLTSAAAAANVRFVGTTALTRAWFSITDDGTNVTFKYLPEGNASNAVTLYTVAKASGYLGASGYSHICFGVARRGAGSTSTLLSWTQS